MSVWKSARITAGVTLACTSRVESFVGAQRRASAASPLNSRQRVVMEYEEEDGDEEDNINQEDCWEVISAYFEEKGLVRQQVLAA